MFLTVLFNIMSLAMLIGAGFAARKAGIINDHVSAGLSGLLLNVAMPAFIVMSMQQEFSMELLLDGGLVFSIFVALHVILAVGGLGLARILRIPFERKGVFLFALTFGNVGFMGQPVVGPIFGELGVFYITMVNVAFCILVPLLGQHQIKLSIKKAEDSVRSKRKFKPNMPLLSALVGIVLFLTSTTLPLPVASALNHAAGSMAAISMIAIGGLMAKSDLKVMFTDKGVFLFSAIKLIAIPLICIPILRLFIDNNVMIGVVIYLIAMPAPALVAIFAEQHKTDPQYASSVVMITTALSLLTIPLIALFL